MGPAILGTLLITGMAALISIPVGVLGAVYLNEYGKNKPLARFIRTMADVMTGVPSIMMGLFIYVGYVTVIDDRTGFAGALALACLMLPIVIRSTEEMLRLVPDELRLAACGAGRAQVAHGPGRGASGGVSGITSGSLLAVARAAGETAPISSRWARRTCTSRICSTARTRRRGADLPQREQPFAASQERAWGAALTSDRDRLPVHDPVAGHLGPLRDRQALIDQVSLRGPAPFGAGPFRLARERAPPDSAGPSVALCAYPKRPVT